MSPSENCRGLSTSRARRMRPAQVPKMGLPLPWNFAMAGAKSHASMSFSRVVDSPPGMMSPSTASSSAGFRTSTELDAVERSEEHTSELQSRLHLVCRLLLEKKKTKFTQY